MTNTSKPLIFFGTEDFSLSVLSALIEADYDIAAVITKPDSKKGRGQKLSIPSVKKLAIERDISVWQPVNLPDITSDIKNLAPIAGILVSYGKIIPAETINLFTPGVINVHPSLLPKYRGPSPVEAAIKNGDSQTGVSIMKLGSRMDAGPLYAARKLTLKGNETKPQLYKDLFTIGTELLLEILPDILSGQLVPTDQNEQEATYCKLLTKADGLLNPAYMTAIECERRVRAYLGYPNTRVVINGQEIIITKAHISTQKNTPLDIQCRDGAFLSIDELISPVGRRITASDYINGYLR